MKKQLVLVKHNSLESSFKQLDIIFCLLLICPHLIFLCRHTVLQTVPIMEEAREECCIICTLKTSDNDSHLVSPKTYDSWQNLLKAAELRKYGPITDAAKELGGNEFPKIYYHRRCRSIFTMKRDLEIILKRNTNEAIGNEDVCSSKRLCRRLSVSRVYDPICIFCKKVKFVKGSKSRENLTKAAELRADRTLRDCAIKKGDNKIMAITSRDIVAAEAHYHTSCYKNYTRVIKKASKDDDERVSEDDTYQIVERQAFADLFEHIRTVVIPNKKICACQFFDNKTRIIYDIWWSQSHP